MQSEAKFPKRGFKCPNHCHERRQSVKEVDLAFLDKEDVPGDGSAGVSGEDGGVGARLDLGEEGADGGDVVAPEEAAGAEEAAVELLNEDCALCWAKDVAGNAGLPHESDPRIGRLGLSLKQHSSK